MIREQITTELSPTQLYQNIRKQYKNTVLLESIDGPTKMTTQSIICFDPTFLLVLEGTILYKIIDETRVTVADDFPSSINYMRDLMKNSTSNVDNFGGGLVGFTSYDIIRSIEKIPDKGMSEEFPDAFYGYYEDAIIYNHLENEISYISINNSNRKGEIDFNTITTQNKEIKINDFRFNTSKKKFMENVASVKRKIFEGEVFQTVLSQSCDFEVSSDRFGLYLQIKEVNPSPYMYCIEFENICVIGSSPELLIEKKNEVLTTYPIAGTRPMGNTKIETQQYKQDLLSDEKEKAEHNMLVDLARNDIGRTSQNGSVQVPQYFEVEYFSHVMHIVSKVTGNIREDKDMFDAFFSLFPAGTVSGAPKIRAMELIEEFEDQRRGPYAGAVGYFDVNGNMVHAITIRSIFGIDQSFRLQAGAGIVYDSVPENEYHESLNKMRAFLRILVPEEAI